jgi:hypothetical protein
MLPITELPDGSLIDVTDEKIVPMGDVFAHRQLTYTHTGNAEQPSYRVVFEVRNGIPVCISLQMWTASDDETHIRAKDLNAIKLDKLCAEVFAYAGVWTGKPGVGFVRKLGRASFQLDKERVEQAGQRRKMTPEFLNRVAELHDQAPEGKRVAAVKAAFGVHERTALRYIAAARREGLIDE